MISPVTKLPASLRQRSDVESIAEDIASYRDLSPAERSRVVSELCRWAADALDASPDPARAWAWEDRRSTESLALWRRLMDEARRK